MRGAEFVATVVEIDGEAVVAALAVVGRIRLILVKAVVAAVSVLCNLLVPVKRVPEGPSAQTA